MGFASGSVTFRRFAIIGQHPANIDQALLDQLAQHALAKGQALPREREMGAVGDDEYGWCGGRHVLDGSFSFGNNVFADAVHFALRIDTNRVPGDLKKAYEIIETDAAAAANPSGFISKLQKRDVKEVVRRKIDEEMRSGRYRRSRLVPILWDLPQQVLYAPASGAAQEKLMEIFERTFGLQLVPLSAGAIALRMLEPRGRRRDYEDLRPTRFVPGPDGEGQYPEYPWVAKGPQPKDFLGNELLLWLWHEADNRTGIIGTESGGDISIYIDRSLDLDCAFGQTGRDSLRGDGPSTMPEARDALRTGKLPRRAGVVMDASNQQFSFTFNPEAFSFSSARLPDIDEAETARVLFEERIALLRDLCKAADALFETFLKIRAGSSWEAHTGAIRRWILQTAKPVAAVA